MIALLIKIESCDDGSVQVSASSTDNGNRIETEILVCKEILEYLIKQTDEV